LHQGHVKIAYKLLNDTFISPIVITTAPELLASACLLVALEISVQQCGVYILFDDSDDAGAKQNTSDCSSQASLIGASLGASYITLAPNWWRCFGIEDESLMVTSTTICNVVSSNK
jgi:hypothetical protein